ncbi:MAG: RNase adapter RapZ [Burkholderiales bacterium]|nr:RNase adapter RapZ [Burkholderiales bacterium]
MQLILITGLSGSGKSVALNVLEDSGFYCVDNLPVKLLPDLVSFLDTAGYTQVALSIDVRSGNTLAELPQQLTRLRGDGFDIKTLFLEAKTETLIKRFSETRRRHPLSEGDLTLPECIGRERERLGDIAELAHHIDTSDMSPSVLRDWVREIVGLRQHGLAVLFQSFGFKHGVPLDADLVFDVRCLPNPHYDPRLQPLTGRDQPVIDFLHASPDAQNMLKDIQEYIGRWLPCYSRDNRSYLTVSIGCTGGRHRSVYCVEVLAAHFRQQTQVLVRHRELA